MAAPATQADLHRDTALAKGIAQEIERRWNAYPSLDALVQAAQAYLNQSYALMDFHTRVMMDEHRKNLEAALSAVREGR